VLGQGRRGIGAKNITLIASILFAYVFGSTAWTQAATVEGGMPTGVRVVFTIAFVLLGFGAPWLVYLLFKLLSRLFGKGKAEGKGGE
jgi:hypothetical protein